MTRPLCANCGKPYGQRDTHTVTMRWEEGEPEAHYQGNLQIVRHGAVRKLPIIPPMSRLIEVWNGRDWIGGYEPFCTLRCGLAYARRAYRMEAR